MAEETTPQLVPRRAGRVILVDAAERVLLLAADVPDPAGAVREVWVLPGGGAEDGESMAEAAARELGEETGLMIAPADLRGPVARSRGTWSGQDITYQAEDAVFFARVAGWTVLPDGLAPAERELAARHRWWPVAEIVQTEATIFPRELGPLVVRLLAGDEPQPPVELPW